MEAKAVKNASSLFNSANSKMDYCLTFIPPVRVGCGCVPFSESQNGFLILDLPDFAVGRGREIRNWICNLGNLSQTRARNDVSNLSLRGCELL